MSNIKVGFVALFLLGSTSVLAQYENAGQLSKDHELNSEEAVVKEFRRLSATIEGNFGPAWREVQRRVMQTIESRDFLHFDPLVRETSCELRALLGVYIVLQLNAAHRPTDDEVNLATLVFILSHALITEPGPDGFGGIETNRRTPLDDFLTGFGVELSRTNLAQMIKVLERAVAYGSVMFARRLAAEIDNDVGRALVALFTRQCIFDDPQRRRPVVSCLGICELQLQFARLRRVPFVVRTRLSDRAISADSKGTVIAVYLYDGEHFQLVDRNTIDPDTPVFVVDAVTTHFGVEDEAPPDAADVERYLGELDFVLAWLSGAAAHPQFAGENADAELVNTPDCELVVRNFQALAEDAERIGTSDTNRSCQFVDHTYVTTLRLATHYRGRLGGPEPTPIVLGNGGLYFPANRAVEPSGPVARPVLRLSSPAFVSELGELLTPDDRRGSQSPFLPLRTNSRGPVGGSQSSGSRLK